MNWQYYTVLTSTNRTFTVRGISERDVRYVAERPTKRNHNRPLLNEGEHIFDVYLKGSDYCAKCEMYDCDTAHEYEDTDQRLGGPDSPYEDTDDSEWREPRYYGDEGD